jgi:hypothetical protein
MHAVNDVVVPGKLAKMAIYGRNTRAPLHELPSLLHHISSEDDSVFL